MATITSDAKTAQAPLRSSHAGGDSPVAPLGLAGVVMIGVVFTVLVAVPDSVVVVPRTVVVVAAAVSGGVVGGGVASALSSTGPSVVATRNAYWVGFGDVA